MTQDNVEARRLIEKSIATKEAELEKTEKERKAAWRKHQRTGDQVKALTAELDGLRDALARLGGPVDEEEGRT